jgi:hypothetical protein
MELRGSVLLELSAHGISRTWIFCRRPLPATLNHIKSEFRAPLTRPHRSRARTNDTACVLGQEATACGSDTVNKTPRLCLLAMPSHPNQRIPHYRLQARRRCVWSSPRVAEGPGGYVLMTRNSHCYSLLTLVPADARFEVLGSPYSILSVTLSASQRLYTRRGTLVSVAGKVENVRLFFAQPPSAICC